MEEKKASRQDWVEFLMFKAERDLTLDQEKVKKIRRILEGKESSDGHA